MMPTVEDIIFHNAYETSLGDSLVYLCWNRTLTPEQLNDMDRMTYEAMKKAVELLEAEND